MTHFAAEQLAEYLAQAAVLADIRQQHGISSIDPKRLHKWRQHRLREQLCKAQAAMCVLVSPISLRYAVDYRSYAIYQSHTPTTYAFVPQTGPSVLFEAYGNHGFADESRKGWPLCVFDGGDRLDAYADNIAEDIRNFLHEIGTSNRRVAVEYTNPSLTQALTRIGLEVVDGVQISEVAKVVKSEDEIACIKWAVAVAEHGIAALQQAMRPGTSELQLWALLGYVNTVNDGDWHEGRMLASGQRTNPWFQEASYRQIEQGDLVAFDTDMVGPFGYFADISRTMLCGSTQPSRYQKYLYRQAVAEIEHNLTLIKDGVSLASFQQNSYKQHEIFHPQAYKYQLHGVGMSDEYPVCTQPFRGARPYEANLATDMVICVESYVGEVGGKEGIKLEQQVRVTDTGYEMLSSPQWDEILLG